MFSFVKIFEIKKGFIEVCRKGLYEKLVGAIRKVEKIER